MASELKRWKSSRSGLEAPTTTLVPHSFAGRLTDGGGLGWARVCQSSRLSSRKRGMVWTEQGFIETYGTPHPHPPARPLPADLHLHRTRFSTPLAAQDSAQSPAGSPKDRDNLRDPTSDLQC